MATVTKPIALDKSMNTTESPSRNIADVLAQELSGITSAITGGSNKVPKTDVATVEPSNTASRAYAVGELVYVNGNLYKVITAISIGATFTVGTNIQSTNVSDTCKELRTGWAVITGNLPNTAGYTTFDLPSGFTKNNTVVVSIYANLAGYSVWRTPGEATTSLYVQLGDYQMQIYTDDPNFLGQPFKIVLAKI